MSLSRILNDEPASSPRSFRPQSSASAALPADLPITASSHRESPGPPGYTQRRQSDAPLYSDRSPSPPHSRNFHEPPHSPRQWHGSGDSGQHMSVQHPQEHTRSLRSHSHQAQEHPNRHEMTSNGYSTYPAEWRNGQTPHPTHQDEGFLEQDGRQSSDTATPTPGRSLTPAGNTRRVHTRQSASQLKDDESEQHAKKKRRNNVQTEDSEYVPAPAPRRSSRRHQRGKQANSQAAQQPAEPREPTAEELRLMSSDLEDCPEIWMSTLAEYVLETQKRHREIQQVFEETCMYKNSQAARDMSHRYTHRVESIPQPRVRHNYVPDPAFAGDSISVTRNSSLPPDDGGSGEILLEFNEYRNGDASYARDYDGAEDAARELEESVLGNEATPRRENRKRGAAMLSEDGSDFEFASTRLDSDVRQPKKRRGVPQSDDIDELERSVAGDASPHISSNRKLAKARDTRGGTPMSTGGGEGAKTRKKPGPKKKTDVQALKDAYLNTPSVGDVTPVHSAPPSPALSATVIFEIDGQVPPLKRAKKIDDASMLKRIHTLQESQKKSWVSIARRDVAKVYKFPVLGFQQRQAISKRVATLAATQGKKPWQRSVKTTKDTQTKAKRLMREMMSSWKRNEREERDVRKRAEKEATDRAKLEEEKREAARQARKLEFLISQTELYSHFVGNKLKTAEVEGDGKDAGELVPAGAEDSTVDPNSLQDIDFDDEDQTNLHRHARLNAESAITMAKQKATEFDAQAALERKTNEAIALAKAQGRVRNDDNGKESRPLVDLDSDELNFQNPTSLTEQLTITQPRMLMAQLKEYQLKGLNWLATLYEQGINGILADEMGLGKTVQSISLLAYLAETHDIWGPFLVVAPASTLHNWQQEITRFVPKLKALPYWGNVKDRATLRKFWSKKEISYNEEAPFHILITSYQLVTQDQQHFQRVKWQYMILDEAQNIKNSSSVRWKTLLGFQCRNRLLLTGTPIQNNMQELWALLHFIMPSLFDSHDEFSEWFSKDIENAAAENKGSKLNEHQLRRLHMILKPFMLRRVKRHVQNELSDKIEIDIYVDLSARQRKLYRALRANVSVADLIEKAANIGDADAARSLMNLVMQFRKVCNHPELFERADVVSPYSFCHYGKSVSMRDGDLILCYYSTRNPISFDIPSLLYLDGGILSVPQENSRGTADRGVMQTLTRVWSTDYIERSWESDLTSPFSFLSTFNMSASDVHSLYLAPLIHRIARGLQQLKKRLLNDPFISEPDFTASASQSPYYIPIPSLKHLDVADKLPALSEISTTRWTESCLSRPGLRWFIPPAVAPPISMYCADRTFLEKQSQVLDGPSETLALYGLPTWYREDLQSCATFDRILPGISSTGLIQASPLDQLPVSRMQVPEAKRLIYDSAKLAKLDTLLHELKAADHRVLIYFQMTRMMDLVEEYLVYRQYKYLRLDGSSKLEDRRDMVIDWQTRPEIFVFLLSTRAGGLGINLTAADTVVFYDHDWNPSNDAQAMDRAHRLGQTRQVTVYRLITKGTIDERIVQLARVKKDVQDIVVGNKNFTDVTKPNEIVSLLLNDDELANLEKQSSGENMATTKRLNEQPQGGETSNVVRDLWAEEGDDFFGHSGLPSAIPPGDNQDEDDGTPKPTVSNGRAKKGRQSAAARGRRPGQKPKRKAAGDSLPDDI